MSLNFKKLLYFLLYLGLTLPLLISKSLYASGASLDDSLESMPSPATLVPALAKPVIEQEGELFSLLTQSNRVSERGKKIEVLFDQERLSRLSSQQAWEKERQDLEREEEAIAERVNKVLGEHRALMKDQEKLKHKEEALHKSLQEKSDKLILNFKMIQEDNINLREALSQQQEENQLYRSRVSQLEFRIKEDAINNASHRKSLKEKNASLQQTVSKQEESLKTKEAQIVMFTEQMKAIRERHAHLEVAHRALQEASVSREQTLSQAQEKLNQQAASLGSLTREKEALVKQHQEDLAEQHQKAREELARLTVVNSSLQERVSKQEERILKQEESLKAKAELELTHKQLQETLREQSEQHQKAQEVFTRTLQEKEAQIVVFTQQMKAINERHAQLEVAYKVLQEDSVSREQALLQAQEKLNKQTISLESLTREKEDLAKQHQEDLAEQHQKAQKELARLIVINTSLQQTVSKQEERILGYKKDFEKIALQNALQTKTKIKDIAFQNALAHLQIGNSLSLLTNPYSPTPETSSSFLESHTIDSSMPITSQLTIEENITEQVLQARKVLSWAHSKRYNQLLEKQTKAEIAQVENLKKLKLGEEKENLLFEKNRRSETARQLLELELESRKSSNSE
jgi:hypothetical protein